MKNMTLQNIAQACNGQLIGNSDQVVSGVVIDSRIVEKDNLFIATVGERVDGHRFVDSAFEKGALACVVEKLPEVINGPLILVKDSFEALRKIGTFYRETLGVKVVGIAGSVGKTSTKEFIASVLAQHYSVCKTKGNLNNEVGVPLTICQIEESNDIAVLEMGISDFNEMRVLSKIAQPDVVVMTNIGVCHLENLIDRNGVFEAKTEIFESMNKEGFVVLNGEDDKLNQIQTVYGKKPFRFGFNDSCDAYADQIENLGLFGSKAVIHLHNLVIHAEVPLPGQHHILNAMAASIVGVQLGCSVEEIEKGIASVKPVAGRTNLIRTEHLNIIDDCYNANPISMKAALDMLSSVPGRKVAILGDMFELGEDEKSLHAGVGAYAEEKQIDVVLCVGDLSVHMANACSHAIHFNTKAELISQLGPILQEKDTVLIKASHGMVFEELVEYLRAQ